MTSTAWQLDSDGPQRYEDILVPAILGPAARTVVDRARVRPHESVLDVGCGTGAAARFIAATSPRTGLTAGVDINPGMVVTARRCAAAVGKPASFHIADAVALPYRAASFDVVVCAQSLQFVPDPVQAAREIARVMRPGGRTVIGVWCPIGENAYFDALIMAMEQHVGPGSATGLRAAFRLSDPALLRTTLESAGFTEISLERVGIELDLPPFARFVPRHISATPMHAAYMSSPPSAQSAVVRSIAQRLAAHAEGMRVPFRTYTAEARVAGA